MHLRVVVVVVVVSKNKNAIYTFINIAAAAIPFWIACSIALNDRGLLNLRRRSNNNKIKGIR